MNNLGLIILCLTGFSIFLLGLIKLYLYVSNLRNTSNIALQGIDVGCIIGEDESFNVWQQPLDHLPLTIWISDYRKEGRPWVPYNFVSNFCKSPDIVIKLSSGETLIAKFETFVDTVSNTPVSIFVSDFHEKIYFVHEVKEWIWTQGSLRKMKRLSKEIEADLCSRVLELT